jgi:hypothetical protein
MAQNGPSRGCWKTITLLVCTLAVALVVGCQGALFTALYVLRGNDIPAECKILKEKKVAVVCRPVVELQFGNAGVDQDLASHVAGLIKKNVPKVKVVDPRKVSQWIDENSWNEYAEVGKAVGADYVVGIDLEHFELYKSQQLLQGKANARLKVYDCQTGELVFEKRVPQSIYPPNREVAVAERPAAEFRRDFLQVLADQIARHFYDHEPYTDVALDSKTIE